jgi:hypothetical protein
MTGSGEGRAGARVESGTAARLGSDVLGVEVVDGVEVVVVVVGADVVAGVDVAGGVDLVVEVGLAAITLGESATPGTATASAPPHAVSNRSRTDTTGRSDSGHRGWSIAFMTAVSRRDRVAT